LGLGVGIERFDAEASDVIRARQCPFVPLSNENIVNNLFNLDSITFNFFAGRFEHDRIFSGDDTRASLVAVSDSGGSSFNINFAVEDQNINPILERSTEFDFAGGGNFVLVEPGGGGIHPIVLDQNGVLSDRLTAGIIASTLLQAENVDQAGLTGAGFFAFMRTYDAALDQDRINTLGRANAASAGDSFRPTYNAALLGAVINGQIVRAPLYDLIGVGQQNAKRRSAIDAAAVFINIDPALNEILTASNIEYQE
jgi:hypothetical protein